MATWSLTLELLYISASQTDIFAHICTLSIVKAFPINFGQLRMNLIIGLTLVIDFEQDFYYLFIQTLATDGYAIA